MSHDVKWAAWNFANSDQVCALGVAAAGRARPKLARGRAQVLIAFRVLGSRKHEHWLNKAAVAITARRNTKHGRMCHVELMLQTTPGHWTRFGIVKKSYVGNDRNGRPLFQEGRVHAKARERARASAPTPRRAERKKRGCAPAGRRWTRTAGTASMFF